MENQQIWFGTSKACEYLGVNLRTLYRLIDAGSIEAFKIGRVIRIRKEELDRFLENAKIKPGALDHLVINNHLLQRKSKL